jgi:hypothetical protein
MDSTIATCVTDYEPTAEDLDEMHTHFATVERDWLEQCELRVRTAEDRMGPTRALEETRLAA